MKFLRNTNPDHQTQWVYRNILFCGALSRGLVAVPFTFVIHNTNMTLRTGSGLILDTPSFGDSPFWDAYTQRHCVVASIVPRHAAEHWSVRRSEKGYTATGSMRWGTLGGCVAANSSVEHDFCRCQILGGQDNMWFVFFVLQFSYFHRSEYSTDRWSTWWESVPQSD